MVGPLAVANTQPQDGASEADPNSPIVVIFNKPAVALVGIEDQAKLPQPLTLEPAVEGEGQWISTTIYQFRPSQPLGGGVTYQATVEPLRTVAGEAMTEPYTFQFTVAAPIVLASRPRASSCAPTAPVAVAFSQPMDPASTEAAFALAPQDRRRNGGSFAWNMAGTVMTFTPASELAYGVVYTASVAPPPSPPANRAICRFRRTQLQMRCTIHANLRDAFSSSFTVVPLPAVSSATILDGATGVNPETDLRIRFTAPVSSATVIDNIRVEPLLTTTQVMSYTYSDYYENTNQNQTTINTVIPPNYDTHLTLNWWREPNTTYTVTIGGGVEDQFGNTMGDDYVLNFTTGDYSPLLQLKLDRFTHFTADSEPIVAVRYRNVDKIDAALLKLPLPDLYLLGGQNSWSVWDTYELPNRAENLIWEKSVPADGEPNVVNLQGFKLVDAEGNPLPPGAYLFEVRNPLAGQSPNGYSQEPETLKAVIILSDYNITLKRATGGESLAWVTDLRSGQPVADVPVVFSQENQERGQAVTGADGLGPRRPGPDARPAECAGLRHQRRAGPTGLCRGLLRLEPGHRTLGVGFLDRQRLFPGHHRALHGSAHLPARQHHRLEGHCPCPGWRPMGPARHRDARARDHQRHAGQPGARPGVQDQRQRHHQWRLYPGARCAHRLLLAQRRTAAWPTASAPMATSASRWRPM